jgi:L-fucose mutarotase
LQALDVLKTISPLLTADALWALAAMGHGDTLAIVDANYPAHATHGRVIPLPGAGVVPVVEALGSLFPIDDVVERPVVVMTPDDDPDQLRPVHHEVRERLEAAEGRALQVEALARTAFYQRARGAFAAFATTEPAPFACILLTKGVVRVEA